MNQLWIVVAVVLALVVFMRLRGRRGVAQRRRPPASGPRVQGHQVRAHLHARMGPICLFDSGVQFGRGFRRKEGPTLPHDALCRCEAVPFSFSSNEVFNGALRGIGGASSDIAGLSLADGARLIECLKAAEAGPLPADAEAYAAAVGVDAFPAAVRPALNALLAERLDYLRRQPRESAPAAGALTPNGMRIA